MEDHATIGVAVPVMQLANGYASTNRTDANTQIGQRPPSWSAPERSGVLQA